MVFDVDVDGVKSIAIAFMVDVMFSILLGFFGFFFGLVIRLALDSPSAMMSLLVTLFLAGGKVGMGWFRLRCLCYYVL